MQYGLVFSNLDFKSKKDKVKIEYNSNLNYCISINYINIIKVLIQM